MPDYNPQDYAPSYGGQIDSNGNIKNIADAITGSGANTKLKVESGPPQVIFVQSAPTATWTIDHNTNRFPQVTSVDINGAQIVGEVSWPSINQVVITFSSPIAGKAFLT